MKILLVCPECPETFWSFKHALRIISRKALLPPLGLLTVAVQGFHFRKVFANC
jgi:hypothetical protein